MRLGGYFRSTLHPWSCVIFVLPLLLTYEAGLLWLPSSQPETLRNGADTWLREALAALGLVHLFWAPALLMGILVLWSLLLRRDRPADYLSVWIGMALESALFSFGLYGLSRALWPIVNQVAMQTALPPPEPALEQVIGFVGAGIYEETLFRLLLFSALMWIFHLTDFPSLVSFGLAALGSALLFAGAHHLGPHGESFAWYVFLFRSLAGVYFVFLFQLRGFGIAVGAHAGYDVLVGMLV